MIESENYIELVMYKLAEIQIESLPEKNKDSTLELADYSIIWDFSNKTIEKSRDGRYCGKKIRNVQADVQIICRTIRRLGLMLIAFYEFLFGQN